MDPITGLLTGKILTLKYHYDSDILDFLVLRQNYDLAIQRNWRPDDRFRSVVDNSWWEGQLVAIEPVIADSKSMFLSCRIR